MTRWRLISALRQCVICLALFPWMTRASADQSAALESKARAFVETLSRGDFKTSEGAFDSRMQQALPEEKLAAAWKSVTGANGRMKGVRAARVDAKDSYQIVILTEDFERGPVDVRVVFDTEGKIAGLFFKPANDSAGPGPWQVAARKVLDQLLQGQFEAVAKMFDSSMARSVSKEELAETWQAVQSKGGKFQNVAHTKVQRIDKYFAVFMACKFENTMLTVKVVFNSENQIAGLFILPGDLSSDWTPPPYGAPKAFSERDVSRSTNALRTSTSRWLAILPIGSVGSVDATKDCI